MISARLTYDLGKVDLWRRALYAACFEALSPDSLAFLVETDVVLRLVPHGAVSANADILMHYFAWALETPRLRSLLLVPGAPRLLALSSRLLPKRAARGRPEPGAPASPCESWEECSCSYEEAASRYYGAPGSDVDGGHVYIYDGAHLYTLHMT
jgi:hypothetical protein